MLLWLKAIAKSSPFCTMCGSRSVIMLLRSFEISSRNAVATTAASQCSVLSQLVAHLRAFYSAVTHKKCDKYVNAYAETW